MTIRLLPIDLDVTVHQLQELHTFITEEFPVENYEFDLEGGEMVFELASNYLDVFLDGFISSPHIRYFPVVIHTSNGG